MKKQHEMSAAEWRAWKSSRPAEVQGLIEEFPYGQEIRFTDTTMFIIGWTDEDEIVASPINPYADFAGSRADYKKLPAAHLRKPVVVH